MKIDGACHCGDLTYEAEIDPDNVVICHCTDCQVMSATAYRIVARSKPDMLTLLSGEPSTYSKIGTSGAERVLSFCPKCGTNVFRDDGWRRAEGLLHPDRHNPTGCRARSGCPTVDPLGAALDRPRTIVAQI